MEKTCDMLIKSFKTYLYILFLVLDYSLGKKKIYFHGREKSFCKKLINHISWLLRNETFNNNYYAFGLNLKNKKQKAYIGSSEFLNIKNRAEKLMRRTMGASDLSYEVITKDKFVTHGYISGNDIPCVPVEGMVSWQGINMNGETKPLEALYDFEDDLVLKNILMESGNGFMLCKPLKSGHLLVNREICGLSDFIKLLEKGRWVLQKRFKSHRVIREVNDTALNSTRIVTIFNGKYPVYLGGFQSFATQGGEIDSWDKGSIYVGIDPYNSALKGQGFFHPAIKGKSLVSEHPDSKIKFDGLHIPYLKEARELCLRAHKIFYNHFIIGWDVAITDDGPKIIEANEKPGMNAVQCLDGGLRNIVKETFTNLKRELDE